jgi:hypothetical protein
MDFERCKKIIIKSILYLGYFILPQWLKTDFQVF